MLRSYLKILFRIFSKTKLNTGINVTGLAAGLSFAMFIAVFIHTELQVGKNLREPERLFMIEGNNKTRSAGFPFFSPSPLAKAAAEEYPTIIENYYRFWDRMITVSRDDKHFRIQSMIGDSTFFDMFGFEPLYGHKQTAFREPNSIVITEAVALQYFNEPNVVGKTLTLATERSGQKEFKITAVVPDFKRNVVTDFMNMNARIFLSLENASDFPLGDPSAWNAGSIIGYVKLVSGAETQDALDALNLIAKKHLEDEPLRNLVLSLVSLESYHLNANNGAMRKLLLTLSVIGAFILALAIINYINISIASASGRLREIGVRKVVGGIRRQLFIQFMGESVVVALFAGILSVVSYVLLRNVFGEVVAVKLPHVSELTFNFWKWFVMLILIIGVTAGSYPAVFLSSSKTLECLRGKFKSTKRGRHFSRVLVTGQFAIASFIFIGAIVLNRQVAFFTEKDLGYDHSFVLTVSSVPRIRSEEGLRKMESAKKEFLKSSRVEAAALSWEIPTGNYADEVQAYASSGASEKAVPMPMIRVDENYAKVFGMNMLDGKFFYSDSEAWQPQMIVLNETAAKTLNASVGDKVSIKGVEPLQFTVTGVVRDFNFFSLHTSMRPMIILHTNENQIFRHLSFKLAKGNLEDGVDAVQQAWREIFPDDPFDFAFMDERLASMYKTEVQLKKAANVATVLMLIIVFTGVFGLVSMMVTERTKEIGIRKVMGATVANILLMLNSQYVRLMSIAFVVAVPLAWYGAREWLQVYAYRIDLTWWMFVAPIASVIILTTLVVSVRSIKTSLSSPARALRYE